MRIYYTFPKKEVTGLSQFLSNMNGQKKEENWLIRQTFFFFLHAYILHVGIPLLFFLLEEDSVIF